MIILIIMLLFVVAVDLLIMWRIYKKLLKDMHEIEENWDRLYDSQNDLIREQDHTFDKMKKRIARLEVLNGQKRYVSPKVPAGDLPFPEVLPPEPEEPTDDYYPDIDDYVDDLPYR